MKAGAKRIFKLVFIGIIIMFFQIFIAPKFVILNTIPNFLIAYIIFVSIHMGHKTTLTFAFFLGVAFDLIYPLTIGLNAFAFLLISFMVNRNHKSINKDKFSVVLICIFAMCLIYYFVFYISYLFAAQIDIKLFSVNLFSIVYNSIATLLALYFLHFIDKIRLSFDV